jgi:TatD DNase family protein
MIDSHCHPQFPQYDADREEVIKRTLAAGCGMICVGTDLEMSKKAIELAEKYDGIWATVGCHPNESIKELQIADYEELAKHLKVVAIGETGLDYYRTPEKNKQEKQKEIFQQFLELSEKLGKPIIIHCRDPLRRAEGEASAHNDLLAILNSHSLIPNLSLRGVIHSFTGTSADATRYLKLGFYIALNGIITFSDAYDEFIKVLPLNRFLIETDAPYLAPEPYRGKRNEPLYVAEVAKKIAELKGMDYDKIASTTFENTKKLFNIHIPRKYEARLIK